jgi:hypothetical protein
MKVSKAEFYWACQKIIPKSMSAIEHGASINVQGLVNEVASTPHVQRLESSEDAGIQMALNVVSVVANEIKERGTYSFSSSDEYIYPSLPKQEVELFDQVKTALKTAQMNIFKNYGAIHS